MEAVLRRGTNAPAMRWGATLTLFGLAVAARDTAYQRAIKSLADSVGLPGWSLRMLQMTGDASPDPSVDPIADSLLANRDRITAPTRWLLAEWATRRGRPRDVDSMHSALTQIAAASGRDADITLARLVATLRPLARGDTAAAIAALSQLRVQGSYQDVVWQPWSSLGAARLLLARLLLASGKTREAIHAAAYLDALEPAPYLLYYRGSLEVREQAARELGDAALARAYRARIDALQTAALNP
jgi:hypothetical protein